MHLFSSTPGSILCDLWSDRFICWAHFLPFDLIALYSIGMTSPPRDSWRGKTHQFRDRVRGNEGEHVTSIFGGQDVTGRVFDVAASGSDRDEALHVEPDHDTVNLDEDVGFKHASSFGWGSVLDLIICVGWLSTLLGAFCGMLRLSCFSGRPIQISTDTIGRYSAVAVQDISSTSAETIGRLLVFADNCHRYRKSAIISISW